jgi:hypothetical protein
MKSLTQKKSSKPGWEKTGCSTPYPGRAVQCQPGVQDPGKLPRNTYQYQAKPKDDSIIQEALTTMVDKHPTTLVFGSRITAFVIGVRSGTRSRSTGKWSWISAEEPGKRLPERVKQPLTVPTALMVKYGAPFLWVTAWSTAESSACSM